MGQISEGIANEAQSAISEIKNAVNSCSDSKWTGAQTGEGWNVCATAHHVAIGMVPTLGFVQLIVNNQPFPPFTFDGLNQMNADHARDFAGVSKADTLAELDKNANATLSALRSLADEEMKRSAQVPFFGRIMTAEEMARDVYLGHLQEHLGTIKAAI
ncbi:MAG TPA: DinB family protein [Dehalococcoidia bacterium]|nr:DinB family protein [Dehalococcoidia bacterium]